MRVFTSDHYTIPLPDGHRFPMEKYRLIREALIEKGIVQRSELVEAECADLTDILRVHTARYVGGVLNGTLPPLEQRRIGFPWTPALVTRSLATVGGCLAATRAALEDGISGNLAGGTHHAMRDGGEGYCVFNDMAIVAAKLIAEGSIQRIAIVDLDVHQGNGTAEILSGFDSVKTLSMHGAKNFPFRKVASTVDVDLEDGTTDEQYLRILESILPNVLSPRPDLVIYQHGVDPLASDALGRLSLTFEGLAQRDRHVLATCKRMGIPVVLALGGGYAKPISDTIEAQCNTYRVAREIHPNV